jgi:hypothetical protein
MGRVALAAVFAAVFCAQPGLAATPEVGDTVTVNHEVTAEAGAIKRALEKGAKVFQDEILVTGDTASAEIELLDKTKLAVGASARIVLDKFVYDASAAPGSISINLAKGAFRFITGSSPKAAYEIKTPTASMGVRGTIFDVYVADNGESAVLLHEGGVDVCPTPATCKRHDKVGHFVHVGRWQEARYRSVYALQLYLPHAWSRPRRGRVPRRRRAQETDPAIQEDPSRLTGVPIELIQECGGHEVPARRRPSLCAEAV